MTVLPKIKLINGYRFVNINFFGADLLKIFLYLEFYTDLTAIIRNFFSFFLRKNFLSVVLKRFWTRITHLKVDSILKIF